MFTTRSALGGLAFVVLASAPATGQDAWTRVPPLPQGCYDNTDPGFVGQLQTISHEIVVATDRQQAINAEIRQKSVNMDMMEKQQKMMAFMQKNPAEAGKLMQDIATAGQKSGQEVEQLKARTQAFNDELQSAERLYAADTLALNNIQRDWAKVAPAPGSPGNPALARQLAAKHNAEYERLCEKWLKSESSPLLRYLANYKSYLLAEQIPMDDQRAQWEKKEFDLYGVPSTGFKSTAIPKAVTDYLNALSTVFSRRKAFPLAAQ